MSEYNRILDAAAVATFDDFLNSGGGLGLSEARKRTPESIIEQIERAGLRGRGGAGFPTGLKWRSVLGRAATGTPIIINAAEGEPGTFKDRALLRTNPYRALEGACIAATALRSNEILCAVKASFSHEIERLETAIDAFKEAGWIDDIEVRIVEGPSEYLFGEDTALLEVIDGRQPFPRIAPSYRRGIQTPGTGSDTASPDGLAALVNNVETLANVPGILSHGPDWFRSVGTRTSPGTLVCTVTGDTTRHGVGEFPMGTPLREVIELLGGPMAGNQSISAVLSGVANPALGPDRLDTPLTYEDMVGAGSGLGSGTFIVIGDQTSLVSAAAGVARFLSIESCGQCEPCKRDGLAISSALTIGGSSDTAIERLATVANGARCALAGQVERVVGSLLTLANGPSHETAPTGSPQLPYPILPLVDIVAGRAVLDETHLRKRPDWSYETEGPDSYAWPAALHRPVDTRTRSAEPASSTPPRNAGPASAEIDPFQALHESHRHLEAQLTKLRSASPDDRAGTISALAVALQRHQKAMEYIVYPVVKRLNPDIGDDISWYPSHHEQHAVRLLADLQVGESPASPRLVDVICADLHKSVIEIDLRILPDIERAVRK